MYWCGAGKVQVMDAVGVLEPAVRADPVVDAQKAAQSQRIASVDLLRGIVMVLMALDHTRVFFSDAHFNPTDLAATTPAYFFTRWVTHFCAPVFIFLAGMATYLAWLRGKSKRRLSWFLLTRGFWLAVLEFTVINWIWNFNIDWGSRGGAVIWAIGCCLILLSVLIFLPTPAVAVFGVGIIACHNLFENVQPDHFGRLGWLWQILYSGGMVKGVRFLAAYPLLPWMGVVAAGYASGSIYRIGPRQRWKALCALGAALTLGFILLRWWNQYGDPYPWLQQKNELFSLLSFLNCWKHPPSLLYLLMTLGPAIFALGIFEFDVGLLGRPLVVFGRVPLFYYLLHILLIHALALAAKTLHPRWLGVGLPLVFTIWLTGLAAMFPLCWWFSKVKERRHYWWLSYL